MKPTSLARIFASLLLIPIFSLITPKPVNAVLYCDPPLTGNWTISAPCVLYENANGTANGNVTLGAGAALTLYSGKTLVWYPGQTITIPTGASITIQSTSSLSQNYLCVKESGTNANYAAAATSTDPSGANNFGNLYLGLDQQPAGAISDPTAVGLVSRWKMDETSGAVCNDSFGSNNGTATTVTWPAGKVDGSYGFNGSSSTVSIPVNASLNLTSGYSIALWAKVSSNKNYNQLINKGADTAENYEIYTNAAGGVSGEWNFANGRKNCVNSGSITLTPNTWYHIAVTFDGSQCQTYINGVLASTVSAGGTTTTTTSPATALSIGYDQSAAGRYTGGSIDDVRIYNTVITHQVISQLAGGKNAINKYCPAGYIRRENILSKDYVDFGTTGTTAQLGYSYRYFLNKGFGVSSINSGAKLSGTGNPISILGDNLHICSAASTCSLTPPANFGNLIAETKVGVNTQIRPITTAGSYTYPVGNTTTGAATTYDNYDITVPSGATVYLWGPHNYNSVTVASGGIIDVDQFGAASDTQKGGLYITANTISVTGTGKINAYGRGFGGGGGGGGGRYGDGGYCQNSGGLGGSVGDADSNGIVGQSNGGTGGAGCRSAGGNGGGFLGFPGKQGWPGAPGGDGGNGAGPFGGLGGAGQAVITAPPSGTPSPKGGNGTKGGYLASGANGDTTTDISVYLGSGGGGGGGSSSNNGYCGGGGAGGDGGVAGGASPASCSGGGGGGGGAAGGGSITLYANTSITISGQIIADGAGNATLGAGYGAGGGISMSAPTINLTGATIRSLGGNQVSTGSTTNGGTIKVFTNSYTGNAVNTTNFPSGRALYVSTFRPTEYPLDVLVSAGETGAKIQSGLDNVRTRLTNTGTGGRIFDTLVSAGSSAFGQGKFVISDRSTNLSTDTARLTINNAGSVGIGTTAPDSTLTVNGAISNTLEPAKNLTYYRSLAAYSANSAVVGTMEIILPKDWSNTMMTVKIQGYDYGKGPWELIVGGYNYAPTTVWNYAKASSKGRVPFSTVRVARDTVAGKNVILLGDLTTSWSYPKITVSEMLAGYSNYTGWGTGWSITLLASEANIANITSATLDTYTDTSVDLHLSNNLTTTQGITSPKFSNTAAGYNISNDWFSFNNVGTGLYWPNSGHHFYALNANDFQMRSGSAAASGLQIANTGGSATYGYLYGDSSGMGFLNSGGSWVTNSDAATTYFYSPIIFTNTINGTTNYHARFTPSANYPADLGYVNWDIQIENSGGFGRTSYGGQTYGAITVPTTGTYLVSANIMSNTTGARWDYYIIATSNGSTLFRGISSCGNTGTYCSNPGRVTVQLTAGQGIALQSDYIGGSTGGGIYGNSAYHTILELSRIN